MRIAFLPDGHSANTMYRCRGPMQVLAHYGHETRELDPADMRRWPELLAWCEVLHIHRVCDAGTVSLVETARQAGAVVVWDDDDDVTQVPRHNPNHREAGGLKGTRRLAARRRLFELVDLVTTPSAVLAETFRDAGAAAVRVLENYVIQDRIRPRLRDPGTVTIGWTAGSEHQLDVERLPIREALGRLLDAHPHARVTTLGIALGLRSERYRHVANVPFPTLLDEVAGFDVGIAPLSAHWKISRSRSNVKLKEYAAAGVPWLASPIGPYAQLGEREGGRLVADDRWFEELEHLVLDTATRRKLAKRAQRWGQSQALLRNGRQWEDALATVLDGAAAKTG
jgi:glycosyltransferase involved in cell wall biosynthesis